MVMLSSNVRCPNHKDENSMPYLKIRTMVRFSFIFLEFVLKVNFLGLNPSLDAYEKTPQHKSEGLFLSKTTFALRQAYVADIHGFSESLLIWYCVGQLARLEYFSQPL